MMLTRWCAVIYQSFDWLIYLFFSWHNSIYLFIYCIIFFTRQETVPFHTVWLKRNMLLFLPVLFCSVYMRRCTCWGQYLHIRECSFGYTSNFTTWWNVIKWELQVKRKAVLFCDHSYKIYLNPKGPNILLDNYFSLFLTYNIYLAWHNMDRAVRQNLRCSLIQAVSQEEPSDRKPDPWPLWMAGHAQLKFVMMECLKT